MSRHRNVRNLTEDDYYDDYDDDDYYDEEDVDESYYHPPPRTQHPIIPIVPKTTQSKHEPTREKQTMQTLEDKIRLVQGMGFSLDRAKSALHATNGDVQEAINILLTGGIQSPPVAVTKSGVTKPPAGFGAPPIENKEVAAKSPAVIHPPSTIDSTSKGHSTPSGIEKDKTIRTPGLQSKKDYGPLPKLPSDLRAELSSQKSRLAMVVVGHVDAGKSTLMGQVMVQLGHVSKRTVEKYQKQASELGKASFALAWVMDEDETERERGVTMDIATKLISTETHDFVILDAPGHADFVPSMITGAAAADVGIVVIAATIGEFEAGFDGGGQTREHIILARGLGVSQLIVAVNKLDTTEWSEQRFLEIRSKIEPFLLQCGFVAKRIQFVPISGLTGANVNSKLGVNNLYAWYKGSTLLEAMDEFQPAPRNVDKPLRIVVNDVYTEGNKGVTVRCRVVQGVVQVGDKVVGLPIGDEAVVSKIEHGVATTENRYKYAMAGDTTEIVLLGIDVARLATGNIISHPHWELRPRLKRKVNPQELWFWSIYRFHSFVEHSYNAYA
jgi:elongation factor 1 alpha-like protein